ncbi:MAG: polyamine ABC transporter ATP-binding protein [Firmicutes bacterium]|nr:polyamine ABC transporter ATP-binding protein [Bacillota bacterium]
MRKKDLETVIELKALVKEFGKQTVVDDVNLKIKKGEFVTLLGPSGCGKTTILRMIAGFEKPTSGTISLEGKDMTVVPPHKRNVNTVFQKYALFPHLDVYGNIAYGLKLKKTPKPQIKEKVEGALKLVGLEDFGHRDVDSLSGGQQQRVAIARAIVNEPMVLLLDEPLGALDLKMRKEMQAELRRMHREIGITFLYVTHDQDEAMAMSDTIVVMNDGVIQQVGTPKQIYDEPSNAFVADFIGDSNILPGIMVADYQVKFLGQIFKCRDKGFAKNQPVDIVIRPEDIYIRPKGQLTGKVVSCIFVGMVYEIEVLVGEYQFTVQALKEHKVDSTVHLEIEPDDIHVMSMEVTTNEFETEMESDNSINIAGTYFDLVGEQQIEKGTPLLATIPFNKVEITDDPDDSKIKGTVTHTLYRGTHYHVRVWTESDDMFIIQTPDEWDIDDQVGIKFNPADITITVREIKEEEVTDES